MRLNVDFSWNNKKNKGQVVIVYENRMSLKNYGRSELPILCYMEKVLEHLAFLP